MQKQVISNNTAKPGGPSHSRTRPGWTSRQILFKRRKTCVNTSKLPANGGTSASTAGTTPCKYRKHLPMWHKRRQIIAPPSPTWKQQTRHCPRKWCYIPTASPPRRRTPWHYRMQLKTYMGGGKNIKAEVATLKRSSQSIVAVATKNKRGKPETKWKR